MTLQSFSATAIAAKHMYNQIRFYLPLCLKLKGLYIYIYIYIYKCKNIKKPLCNLKCSILVEM